MSTATARQLDANRANALLSTGPRTEEGKLTSSRNAQSHGLTTRDALLPGENPDEYYQHRADYLTHFHPTNPLETEMVAEMADLRWRLRRVPAFEAQLLSLEIHELANDPELKPLIESLKSDNQILAVAFKRLVASKVLPNLLNLESRLARRADKIQRQLEFIQQRHFDRQLHHRPPLAPEHIEPQEDIENSKNGANQPIRVPYQPGRNELCPCGSNLKFKRCCLGKHPQTHLPSPLQDLPAFADITSSKTLP